MSFSDEVINQVWQKAEIISGQHQNVKRKDKCGAIIDKSAYGNHNSNFGWDVDHIKPVAQNGSDHINNLQPLHWRNNQSKADGPDTPGTYCVVSAR